MAHIIQLALGAFMSSLRVKGRNKSWKAHVRAQHLWENESADIGKSQRLWKEGNARINKVSVMRPGLVKIIENLRISTHCEWPETDIHIAENACGIDYADTWLTKQVHWVSESQSADCSTTKYGCEDTLKVETGAAQVPLQNMWIDSRVT